jgi:hypothetical protein
MQRGGRGRRRRADDDGPTMTTSGNRPMVDESLHCPSCGELGFLTDSVVSEAQDLFGAICHYCGHFLARDAIIELREEAAAAEASRIKLV